jgi:fermentation-respiration switch protein FrsA (DUF1100 family)
VVTSGKGWETLPPDVRRQADSPWFKSWLLFDPAVTVKKVPQPMLILHGTVDQQTPPSHGDLLAQLSVARKGAPATYTNKVVVPGVNHLMVIGPGDPENYDSLPAAEIAPDVIRAIVAWLNGPVK